MRIKFHFLFIVNYLAPEASEILSEPTENRMDINFRGVVDGAKNAVNNAYKKAGKITNKVGEVVNNVSDQVIKASIKALLSAFDNFVPKKPTNSKSGWICRPIIVAIVFNVLSIILLLTIFLNIKNKVIYFLAVILILISFILLKYDFFLYIIFTIFSSI